MHWNDRGIILSIHKFDEQGAVVRVLTEHHGLHAGVDKYALSSRRRGMYQPGNLVEVEWKARLPEHLGTFRTELIEPLAAFVLDDGLKLAALQSACALLEQLLVEHDPHPDVYEGFLGLLRAIRLDQNSLPSYVRFEFNLLKSLGFGLDVSRCVATGALDNLHYVSPKSGCAVSVEGAAGYEHRLLRLPSFLLSNSPLAGESQSVRDAVGGKKANSPHPNPPPQGGRGNFTEVLHSEILDGLRLCGYFLEHRAFSVKGGNLPRSRDRLFQRCVQRLMPEEKPRGQIVEYQD